MPTPVSREWANAFGSNASIAGVATVAGVNIVTKIVVRFPIEYEATLREIVEQRGLVGRISIDFSEGRPCMVTWEGTR